MSVRRDTAKRREYERERKQRKRLEQINSLPEPERTKQLEANAQRRAYNMSWTWDKNWNR